MGLDRLVRAAMPINPRLHEVSPPIVSRGITAAFKLNPIIITGFYLFNNVVNVYANTSNDNSERGLSWKATFLLYGVGVILDYLAENYYSRKNV